MRLKIFALAIVCGALVAPSALAGKPVRERVPIGSISELEPGAACPVSVAPAGVRIELVGGNQTLTSFDSGRIVLAGRHVDRITNIGTGKSIVLDLQGVYTQVPRSDGSTSGTGIGKSGFVFLPGDEGPGDTGSGRFFLFTGAFRLVYDSSFAVSEFRSVGPMEDVCAMLA
jgi:hypothetical protein